MPGATPQPVTLDYRSPTTMATGPARCQRCDCLLEHLVKSGDCPACGLDYDRQDPATVYRGEPLPKGELAKLATSTPGVRWIPVMVAVLASYLLASPFFTYMCVGVFIGGIIAAALWCGLMVRLTPLYDRVRGRERLFGKRVRTEARFWWYSLLATVLLSVGTIWAVPTMIWFWPFLPSFNGLATEANQNGVEIERMIGPWKTRAKPMGGGIVTVRTDSFNGSALGSGTGFIYLPNGQPMPGYNYGVDLPIAPGWRTFTTD